MMHLLSKEKPIRVVGVALSGRGGQPLVVFEYPTTGDFLPVVVGPFDAEFLIRDYVGEGNNTAIAWLGDILNKYKPKRLILENDDEGESVIRIHYGCRRRYKIQTLSLGEGLALARRLGIMLLADEQMIQRGQDELNFLTDHQGFLRDFFYLASSDFAPSIFWE